LFTVGPGDPRGGQSVVCEVEGTFVRIAGRRTLADMVDIALSMRALT